MSEPDETRAAWLRSYRVTLDVCEEIARSLDKHGDQDHLPDGTGPMHDVPLDLRASGTFGEAADWMKRRCKAASANEGGDGSIAWEHILTEEFFEALAERDPEALRSELVQVAAVAVKWAAAIDRRTQ